MTLRKLTIVPMLALAMFATGCGDDCVSACEDAKECEGGDEDTDCDKECEDSAKEAEDAGCEDQYDEFASCVADQDDVCDIEKLAEACSSEASKYNECLTK
jgi:hypothetical protein